jgi:hypothetical protein
LFDAAAEEGLRSELICYARSVIVDEWQTMQDQQASPRVRAMNRHNRAKSRRDQHCGVEAVDPLLPLAR